MGVDALGGWGHGVAGGGDVVFFFVGLERRLASKMLPPSTGLKIRLKSKYLHLQTYGINIGTNRRYPKAFSQHRRLYTNLDRVFLNLLFFLSRVISPAAQIGIFCLPLSNIFFFTTAFSFLMCVQNMLHFLFHGTDHNDLLDVYPLLLCCFFLLIHPTTIVTVYLFFLCFYLVILIPTFYLFW